MADAKYSRIPNAEDQQPGHSVQFKTQPRNSPINKRRVLLMAASIILVLAIIAIIIVLVLLAKGKEVSRGMAVASDNDVCTRIGAKVLEEWGGGAVDASIAILLCLGAVQPQSNGIGGGGFMLIHTRDDDKVINFREEAPRNASENMYVDNKNLALKGGLASGIPGEVSGYWLAHQTYGKVPWRDLFAPSIEILRTNITVTAHLEGALKLISQDESVDDNFKQIFWKNVSDPNSYLQAGETFTNPKLADAYEVIAEQGRDGFYKGHIAENIVNATRDTGGILTLEDLENYQARLEEPFQLNYRGHKILSVPPPASGHVIALVLQLLDKFDISTRNTTAWNYVLEAFRFGYAARSQTGDVKYSNKTAWVVSQIQSGEWAANVLKTNFKPDYGTSFVSPHEDINQYGNPIYETYDGTHTTHVSVLGPNGEAVSCTSTINLYFGSRVMTDDGIVMNNEMDDFSSPNITNSFGYQPSPENFIRPGKRPLSSSSPTIIFDEEGDARFVTGAAGGSRIITGSLLSVINALDWGMTLEDNLNAPRVHDQLSLETLYEDGFNEDWVSGLSSIGYNMTLRSNYMSVVTSVSSLGDEVEAHGDPRKEGTGIVIPVKN